MKPLRADDVCRESAPSSASSFSRFADAGASTQGVVRSSIAGLLLPGRAKDCVTSPSGQALGSDSSALRARRAVLIPFLAAVAVALAAWIPATARANEGIAAFNTTMSTNLAGAHPDLETFFELEKPGQPEAAQNVIFNAPTGCSATPTPSLSAAHQTSPWISVPPAPRRA